MGHANVLTARARRKLDELRFRRPPLSRHRQCDDARSKLNPETPSAVSEDVVIE
jgi:hypothetical protein